MKFQKKHGFALGVLLLVCLASLDVLACSGIFFDQGKAIKITARNFDFMDGDGFVRFSPTGMTRQAQYSPTGRRPLKWTSQYASIAFTITLFKTRSPDDGDYGAGVDGVNMAGLKVGAYFLEDSEFAKDGSDTTIDIASLMQYILDSFQNVEEAVADLNSGRYRVTSTPTDSMEIKFHLYLHDTAGDSAIVEFIGGKTRITRNPQIPVLTNSIYADSLEHLKLFKEFGGSEAIPGASESLDRFVRGAFYRKHLAVPVDTDKAVNYGFAVAQTVSVSPEFPHGSTQWTIVTDIDKRRVFFRTLNNPAIASIDLVKLADTATVSSDIDLVRTDLAGDINDMFDRTTNFNPAGTPRAPDYNSPANWASAPLMTEALKPVDVFFVHPTVFFSPNAWNESLESNRKNPRLVIDLKKETGVFTKTCNIFAPRYRDANIKVLNSSEENKTKALEVAYSDVEKAFDYYLNHFNQGRPFILAGHSQGSNLLLSLLQRRFTDPQLQKKLIASYIIGWSVTADELKQYSQLAICDTPGQTGCIISYNTQSKAPAITIVRPGAVSVNPLTMETTPKAISKEKNLGAVFFTDQGEVEIANFTGAQTIDGALVIPIPTRVDLVRNADRGFYHPYDYTFFFRNLEKNVAERIAAYMKNKPGQK